MNATTTVLLSIGPFAILIAACLMRAIAAVQSETSWNGQRRRLLTFFSYVLTAVALVGMVFLVFTSGAVGVVGMLLAVFLVFLLSDAEVRIAGARNRARQVELIWMLAIAVKSGRPLADEIESYALGTSGKRYRLLCDMAERLRAGVPLTELAVPQGLLPRSAAMQISAGIAAASLPDTLTNTAVRSTRELSEDDESSNASGALIYPAAVVPIAFLIVGFVMYYIIPKFKKIFDDFGTELPQPTILLIQISDASLNFWYVFALPLFYIPFLIFLFVTMAEYYGWRVMLQSIFGRWFIRWHSPDVMRSLAQSISQDVPLDQALNAIAKHPGPLRLRERLTWAIDQLRAGSPTWQTLQTAGILRHFETIVLETAEQTGNLPWALETLATNIERRSAFRLQATLEILRPIVLIAMSLAVGFIAFALFLPLIKLLNDLS